MSTLVTRTSEVAVDGKKAVVQSYSDGSIFLSVDEAPSEIGSPYAAMELTSLGAEELIIALVRALREMRTRKGVSDE